MVISRTKGLFFFVHMIVLGLVLVSFPAQAQVAEPPKQFLRIDEGNTSVMSSAWKSEFLTPEQITSSSARALGSPSSYSLVKWLIFQTPPPEPNVKYDRRVHFGTWVNDPNDPSCLNTRANVLIRDSKRPVVFKSSNKCVVESGAWNDPYTGQTFTSSADIQIDHLVPLKHAYTSGAWRWDFKTRCLYANFMADDYHLLSVYGRENMRKGDRSPEVYMPPNPKVSCAYLQAWLQVKLAWKLILYPAEAQGIRDLFNRNRCSTQAFQMSALELARLRKSMTDLLPLCSRMARSRADLNSANGISFPEDETP